MYTPYSAEDIAKVFASIAKKEGKAPLTHKKLQKLLYYAQAWNLVFNKRPLFKEPIQAWVHGPVVPSLYKKFKGFGSSPFVIKDNVAIPTLQPAEQKVIDSVWRTYGKHDADYLEMLTHNEEPWLKAREGFDDFESCQNEISLTDMRKFYEQKLQKKQEA